MSRFAVRMVSYSMAAAVGCIAGPAAAQQATRLPSEVLHDVVKWRSANLRATPTEVEAAVTPFLAGVRTTGLAPEEEVALGMSYFFSFDGLSAKPLLEKHMNRDDLLGRVSWQAVQQMTMFGAKDFALGERRTVEFRAKFRPAIEDLEHSSVMVFNLARKSAADGDHARAVQLVLDDLNGLPIDLPFRGYDNLGRHFESFRKVGRDAEALALMKRHRDAMRARPGATLPSGAELPPISASLDYAHRPGVLHLLAFQNWLFDDHPNFSPERAATLASARAVDLFTRWIDAAESGQPLPPR